MRDSELVKKDIIQFLKLCVNYSEKSIGRKYQRRQNAQHNENRVKELETEIKKWENYKQFTEYTIKELSEGELDEWIKNLHNPDFNPSPRENNSN